MTKAEEYSKTKEGCEKLRDCDELANALYDKLCEAFHESGEFAEGDFDATTGDCDGEGDFNQLCGVVRNVCDALHNLRHRKHKVVVYTTIKKTYELEAASAEEAHEKAKLLSGLERHSTGSSVVSEKAEDFEANPGNSCDMITIMDEWMRRQGYSFYVDEFGRWAIKKS